MEELIITALGGIGTLLLAVLGEAIGEFFGAAAEAGGEAVAEIGGAAVGAIAESGTNADLEALGAVAAENNGSSGNSGVSSLPQLHFNLPSRRTAQKDGWLRPDEERGTTKESVASTEEPTA